MIKKLSDRQHVLKRPNMYIGSVNKILSPEYVVENKKIEYVAVEFVPGLIKIINEIIDNCVDVAIKTNFTSCDIINVTMTENFVEVKDNGTGIPVKRCEDGHYLPELAWGHARAGSNFDDDENRTQIGMNGVGSFATNCFSKEFIGITDDGKNKYTIKFINNGASFKERVEGSTKTTGTSVKFYPDLERFGLESIDDTHMSIIKQRLINLSMSFPKITFKFNNKKISVATFKKYVSMFNETSVIHETENYKFAILPNNADDFRQFSYVNGLKIPDGGTHVEIIINSVVSIIRKKLIKKFKTIKPGDIRNKLMVVAFLKDVKNAKFNSQSKEKITNTVSEINKYFGEIPFDLIGAKILKNKEIIDPITEVYRIKEEFKRRQELKGLNRRVKKIRSEKYYPAIKNKKYLMLVEGESAFGGLSPVFGRRECGYYVLRGKPLNAYSSSQTKFLNNKELSELFQVVKNENYDKIIFATDQDLDGFHIRGLLAGFFKRFLPEVLDKIGILQTPVILITKKDVPASWFYNLDDAIPIIKKTERSNYMKGLGSWDKEDLQHVLNQDGLDKMIDFMDFNSDEIIDEWLGDDSTPRKKYILENEFSIAKL